MEIRRGLKRQIIALNTILRTKSMTQANKLSIETKLQKINQALVNENENENIANINKEEIVSRRKLLDANAPLKGVFEAFWLAMTPHCGSDGVLLKQGYIKFHESLQHALMGEQTVLSPTEVAEVDWIHDNRVYGEMNKQAFYDMLFETIDTWSEFVDQSHYAAFAWTLLESVVDTRQHPPRLRVRREIRCVSKMDNEATMAVNFAKNKKIRQELLRRTDTHGSQQALERLQRQAARRHGAALGDAGRSMVDAMSRSLNSRSLVLRNDDSSVASADSDSVGSVVVPATVAETTAAPLSPGGASVASLSLDTASSDSSEAVELTPFQLSKSNHVNRRTAVKPAAKAGVLAARPSLFSMGLEAPTGGFAQSYGALLGLNSDILSAIATARSNASKSQSGESASGAAATPLNRKYSQSQFPSLHTGLASSPTASTRQTIISTDKGGPTSLNTFIKDKLQGVRKLAVYQDVDIDDDDEDEGDEDVFNSQAMKTTAPHVSEPSKDRRLSSMKSWDQPGLVNSSAWHSPLSAAHADPPIPVELTATRYHHRESGVVTPASLQPHRSRQISKYTATSEQKLSSLEIVPQAADQGGHEELTSTFDLKFSNVDLARVLSPSLLDELGDILNSPEEVASPIVTSQPAVDPGSVRGMPMLNPSIGMRKSSLLFLSKSREVVMPTKTSHTSGSMPFRKPIPQKCGTAVVETGRDILKKATKHVSESGSQSYSEADQQLQNQHQQKVVDSGDEHHHTTPTNSVKLAPLDVFAPRIEGRRESMSRRPTSPPRGANEGATAGGGGGATAPKQDGPLHFLRQEMAPASIPFTGFKSGEIDTSRLLFPKPLIIGNLQSFQYVSPGHHHSSEKFEAIDDAASPRLITSSHEVHRESIQPLSVRVSSTPDLIMPVQIPHSPPKLLTRLDSERSVSSSTQGLVGTVNSVLSDYFVMAEGDQQSSTVKPSSPIFFKTATDSSVTSSDGLPDAPLMVGGKWDQEGDDNSRRMSDALDGSNQLVLKDILSQFVDNSISHSSTSIVFSHNNSASDGSTSKKVTRYRLGVDKDCLFRSVSSSLDESGGVSNTTSMNCYADRMSPPPLPQYRTTSPWVTASSQAATTATSATQILSPKPIKRKVKLVGLDTPTGELVHIQRKLVHTIDPLPNIEALRAHQRSAVATLALSLGKPDVTSPVHHLQSTVLASTLGSEVVEQQGVESLCKSLSEGTMGPMDSIPWVPKGSMHYLGHNRSNFRNGWEDKRISQSCSEDVSSSVILAIKRQGEMRTCFEQFAAEIPTRSVFSKAHIESRKKLKQPMHVLGKRAAGSSI